MEAAPDNSAHVAGDRDGSAYREQGRMRSIEPHSGSWNERFQSLLESPSSDTVAEVARVQALQQLVEHFAQEAQRIVRIIVEDKFTQERSIPEVRLTNGVRYVVNDAAFTFTLDYTGTAGSDDRARKAAGNNLKSIMALMNCGLEGIHLPLCVLVDYRGHRVLATADIPTSVPSGELVCVAEDDPARPKLVALGQCLNVRVVEGESARLVGLQAHRATDGRLYITDSSLLYPPEASGDVPGACAGGPWLNVMRPELVKLSPVPLSGSAFARITSAEDQPMDAAIVDLTHRLYGQVIPAFAGWLNVTDASRWGRSCLRLSSEMHRRGIGMRHLAYLRHLVLHPFPRALLLAEMIARVVKNHLRAKMRTIQEGGNEGFVELVLRCFNRLFGKGQTCDVFWRVHVKTALHGAYDTPLDPEESGSQHDVRASLEENHVIRFLFDRLQGKTGAVFSEEVIQRVFGADGPSADSPFTTADLLDTLPVLKQYNMVALPDGDSSLRLLALSRDEVEGIDQMYVLQDEKVRELIWLGGDEALVHNNWGVIVAQLADRQFLAGGEKAHGELEVDHMYQLATACFHHALSLASDTREVLRNYGTALLRQSQLKPPATAQVLLQDCVSKLEACVAADRHNPHLLITLTTAYIRLESFESNYSRKLHLLEVAGKSLAEAARRAEKCGEQVLHYKALHNLGNVLCRFAKLRKQRGDPECENEASRFFGEAIDRYLAAWTVCPLARQEPTLANLADAFVGKAQCEVARPEFMDQLYCKAALIYQILIKCNPNSDDPFFKWANVLMKQADGTTDMETAELLYKHSEERYRCAVEVKPDNYKAWANCGRALLSWAQLKKSTIVPSKADMATVSLVCQLCHRASASLASADRIKSREHIVLKTWGDVLLCHAQTLAMGPRLAADPSARLELLLQASSKYDAAFAVRPDVDAAAEVLIVWADCLAEMAPLCPLESEANSVLDAAQKNYESASLLRPSCLVSRFNLAQFMLRRATQDMGGTPPSPELIVRFLTLAREHLETIQRHSGGMADAMLTLGLVLYELAKRVPCTSAASVEEVTSLLRTAIENYEAVLVLKPSKKGTLVHLANALWELADHKRKGAEFLGAGEQQDSMQLYGIAYSKFDTAVRLDPDLEDAVMGYGAALLKHGIGTIGAIMSSSQPAHANVQAAAVDRLLKSARDKFEMALKHNPKNKQALVSLASSYYEHALAKLHLHYLLAVPLPPASSSDSPAPSPQPHSLNTPVASPKSPSLSRPLLEQAEELLSFACAQLNSALGLDPRDPDLLVSLALALAKRAHVLSARSPSDPVSDKLFRDACTKLSNALKIRPSHPTALRHWRDILKEHAARLPVPFCPSPSLAPLSSLPSTPVQSASTGPDQSASSPREPSHAFSHPSPLMPSSASASEAPLCARLWEEARREFESVQASITPQASPKS